MTFRIGVMGCGGRMGQMLVREIAATQGCSVAGGTEAAGSKLLGQDVGTLAGLAPLNLQVTADPGAVFDAADAVIDFTAPAATQIHARLAGEKKKILVIGTTGLTGAPDEAINAAAKRTTIVEAPNMSLGINLLVSLVEQVAARLGPEFDIEIAEIYHRNKIDAPSGTGLALGAAAARGRGVDLDKAAIRGRDGHTGIRPTGGIGFAAIRGGNKVGDHTVMFFGPAERIELTHKAASRQIYAGGAVKAALWARGRPAGRYGMRDVLGL